MPDKENIIRRLLAKRELDPLTECWLWMGGRQKQGYGTIQVYGTSQLVHRISAHCFLGYDLNDETLQVNHHCDVPACFNPDHVYVGDQVDNMRDCRERGRDKKARGEDSGASKLTSPQVLAIRQRYLAGEKRASLAAAFGITIHNVTAVTTGKYWKHVPQVARRAKRSIVEMDASVNPGKERGSSRAAAKLTESQVLEMRALYQGKAGSQRELAKRFGISQARIQPILTRQAWGHV